MKEIRQAVDDLARISSLVQAIFMAATDLHDRKQVDAIQAICDIADDQIEAVKQLLCEIDGGQA